MPTAMAVNQGRRAVASLAGAPIGGVLYAFGAIWPLASGAVANGVSLTTALFIRTPLGPEPGARRTHPIADLREGFRFVWSVPFRRFMLFFGAFINFSLIGVATVVNLHLVATGTLPVLIGLVDVALGAGMLTGSFAASPLIQRFAAGPLGIDAFIALAVGCAGVAVAPDVWWYLPALFVMGFALSIVNSAYGGYNAVITPKGIMGRAGMISGLGSTIIGPIAPLAGAWLLDWLGVHVAGAVFTVLLAAFVAIIAVNPALRRIGKPDTWAADGEQLAAAHPGFG
jgi:MFS family permease